jgi:hypothetical protein
MKEFIKRIINKDSSLITGVVILGIMSVIFLPSPSAEKIVYAIILGLFAMAGNGNKK